MIDYNLEKRKFVIGGVAIGIVTIYIIRLFTLQIMSDDYKKRCGAMEKVYMVTHQSLHQQEDKEYSPSLYYIYTHFSKRIEKVLSLKSVLFLRNGRVHYCGLMESCAARIRSIRSCKAESSTRHTSRKRAKSVDNLTCTRYDSPSAELNTCRTFPTMTPGGKTDEYPLVTTLSPNLK